MFDGKNTKGRWQFLGYYCGGVFPLALMAVAELAQGSVVELGFQPWFFGMTFCLFALGIPPSIFEGSRNICINVLAFLQPFLSVAAIHFSVLVTGGVISSPLAYSYIYLPSVVGHVFGKNPELWFASVALAASFLISLIWQDAQVELFRSILRIGPSVTEGVSPPLWVYFMVFILQLLVTVFIADRYRHYQSQLNK